MSHRPVVFVLERVQRGDFSAAEICQSQRIWWVCKLIGGVPTTKRIRNIRWGKSAERKAESSTHSSASFCSLLSSVFSRIPHERGEEQTRYQYLLSNDQSAVWGKTAWRVFWASLYYASAENSSKSMLDSSNKRVLHQPESFLFSNPGAVQKYQFYHSHNSRSALLLQLSAGSR